MNNRTKLTDRAKTQREEIQQLFDDTAHWNNTHTRFEQIDVDPDGELTKLLAALNKMLENE